MRCIILLYCILPSCLCFNTSFSQDKIYLSDGEKDGRVTAITPDNIKYKNPRNPAQEQVVSRSKVLFAFNSTGSYFVLGKNNQEDRNREFLKSSALPATDVIFTNQGKRIDCEINKEDREFIYYILNENTKIAKGNIAVVIYKKGHHRVMSADRSLVADILQKDQGTIPTTPGSRSNQAAVVPTIHKVEQTNKNKSPVVNDSTARKLQEIVLADLGVTFAEFEKKTLQKAAELSDYLKVLCNKNTEYEKAVKAIDQACLLFISEDAIVEVSSVNRLNSPPTQNRIRTYLTKLKLLKYGKVEIEWTKIQYVNKLRRADDGTYQGVVSFQQTFTGYIDNKVVYRDFTRKDIQVVLKTYGKSVEGKTTPVWDILLSDIGVTETKRL